MLKKLSLFLLLLGMMAIWAWLRLNSPIANPAPTPLNLVLAKGDGSNRLATELSTLSKKHGGSLHTFEIQVLALITGKRHDFKAGEYEFPATSTLNQIFGKLTRGEVTATHLRIPEGVTWREIKAILAKADLQHDAQNLDVTQAARVLNVDAASIEGMLFPDTYQYRKGEPETTLLKRAHQLLLQKLNAAWETRQTNLPYKTPYDMLTMASIIEKETGIESDRAMVAAVFVNRLKQHMRLQTDPSVIYGMGEAFNGNLTRADLLRDTAFNTYTREGLTPTPIATTSLASINAALNPANSDVLYFVARGDGSSEFSKTLADHNMAVQKYQLSK